MRPIIFISLIFSLTLFGLNISSTFFPLYMQQKGLDNFQIGTAVTILPLFAIIGNFFVQKSMKTIGIKNVLSLAILGYFIFLVLFYLSSNFFEFMFSYVVLGLSAAFLWVAGRSFIFHLKNVVKSTSLFYTSFLATGILAPSFGGFLIQNFGYLSVFTAGSILILLAIPIALLTLPKNIEIKINPKKFRIENKLFKFLPLVLASSFFGNVFFLFPVFLKSVGIFELQIGLLASFGGILNAILQIPSGKLISKLTVTKSLAIGFLLNALGILFLIFLPSTFPQIVVDYSLWTIGGAVVGIAVFAATGHIARVKTTGAQMFELFNNSGGLVAYFSSGLIVGLFGFYSLFTLVAVLAILSAVYSVIQKKV